MRNEQFSIRKELVRWEVRVGGRHGSPGRAGGAGVGYFPAALTISSLTSFVKRSGSLMGDPSVRRAWS